MRVGFDISGLDPNFKEHASQWFKGPPLVNRVINLAPFGRQTLRQQVVYPLIIRQKTAAFDLIHFPAHMDAPSWCTKPYVLTVLDLIPLLMRDLYETPELGYRFRLARWLECQAIKNAAHIVAISECTARDVTRVLGVPAERISVTPLGVDPHFFSISRDARVKARYGVAEDQPLMLYVGGIDQRKNMAGLISVFGTVCLEQVRGGNKPPVLVMAGKVLQHKEYPGLQKMIAALPECAQVVLPGFVPEGELQELYGASDLFFFPSLYEGFGLTPLEAMAAGIPVVSSNTSAMPEVLGDGAVLVDPTDNRAAVAAVLALLRDKNSRLELSCRGIARAKQFTWSRTGDLTVQAYERAYRVPTLATRTAIVMGTSAR